ncbi:hypothetical protein M231_02935 [Tremella mesenterica]|uniref:Uncharacterized protein n=1 Tax=Tremella mesenterica TaxID=5217 RepID=A0A4Q1BPQ7_TREME|nr:hypothetical protein M231_02935 [Tremella mesenterica]
MRPFRKLKSSLQLALDPELDESDKEDHSMADDEECQTPEDFARSMYRCQNSQASTSGWASVEYRSSKCKRTSTRRSHATPFVISSPDEAYNAFSHAPSVPSVTNSKSTAKAVTYRAEISVPEIPFETDVSISGTQFTVSAATTIYGPSSDQRSNVTSTPLDSHDGSNDEYKWEPQPDLPVMRARERRIDPTAVKHVMSLSVTSRWFKTSSTSTSQH